MLPESVGVCFTKETYFCSNGLGGGEGGEYSDQEKIVCLEFYLNHQNDAGHFRGSTEKGGGKTSLENFLNPFLFLTLVESCIHS